MTAGTTSVRVPPRLAQAGRIRPLVVSGTVTQGDQRGRLLGFPTANLAVPDLDISDSVWAGTVVVLGPDVRTTHAAAVSIGRRPTYYGRRGVRLLEAHLLDFSGDLYGVEIEVHLEHFLRLQQRFPGSRELQEQLHADILGVRDWAGDAAHRVG